jgi:predicted N-acetyltransferase YhbS
LASSTQSVRDAIDGVSLRALRAADLPAAHALSEEVRWPHRLVDWQFAFELGDGLVAERDGEIVGTGLRWRWGPRHATVGMVIVAQRCQGRRIGQRLMQGLLEPLHDRTVLLHATPEGRGLYERLGFVQIGEVRQHQGQAVQGPLIALEPGTRLRPGSRRDAARIAALDTAAAGMPRDALLRKLLDAGDTVVLDRDGAPQGFAILRRFGRGQVIGPVVAPDAGSARALISHWVNLHAGRFVRIDTDFACGLTEWLESLGLERAGGPATMVRGPALIRGASVGGDVVARQYALVSQALG